MTKSEIDTVLKRELTPDQYAAATDPAVDVVTLACAGSGKSRTLAYRISRLIAEGADPSTIVAFTFTEKAAEAIKLRVAEALEKIGQEPLVLGRVTIGTIHSFCQATLSRIDARYRQFDVLDENRLKLYVMSRYAQLGLATLTGRRPGTYFDHVTNLCESWQTLNDELLQIDDVIRHDAVVGRLLQGLKDALDDDEYVDFSAMVRFVVDALVGRQRGAEAATAGLRHLLVDEYQDVNPSQEALICELRGRCESLFVVGDDDQAIYGWRGADVTNIQSFTKRVSSASVHELAVNFRSTDAIVSIADAFARNELAATRTPKKPTAATSRTPRDVRKIWFPDRATEAKWVADRIEALLGAAYVEPDGRVRGLTPADFAILMRSTRSAEQDGGARHQAFSSALNGKGIPYSLEAGGDVFERPQVGVLRLAFELLRANPDPPTVLRFFSSHILPAYPDADRDTVVEVFAVWRTRLHGSVGMRLYPQRLVHELLSAFGIRATLFDPGTMQDIGVFSRMIQDVETAYVSIVTATQFGEICDFLHELAERGYNSATEQMLRRPDTVSLSTVHKVKGLEFPVVFIVDVEAGRFPRRRQGYSGWMPVQVLGPALQRGAYQSTPDEEARLFYTALTRAERYLYVTGCSDLPQATGRRTQSRFFTQLAHPELTSDVAGLPAGIVAATRMRRADETVLPTNYSEIRYYLRCPRDYQFRRLFGFSPPITEMVGFGRSVHAAIGKLHDEHAQHAPDATAARDIAKATFHLKHIARSADPSARPGPYEEAVEAAAEILATYARSHSSDFERKRQLEVRFEIPLRQSVIAGAIDLLLHEDAQGRILDAVVVDFKTMEGGPDPEGNERLHWTELSLQVQLYAKAAREVLGQNAATGAVHLLRDDKRVEVPITDEAITAAVSNVEWAVDRIIAGDFPMRPSTDKCNACDFNLLCPKALEQFSAADRPLQLLVPGGRREMARAFSECDEPQAPR